MTLTWAKWWRGVSLLVCETLWIFNFRIPGDYYSVADWWCVNVHSAWELEVWKMDGFPER